MPEHAFELDNLHAFRPVESDSENEIEDGEGEKKRGLDAFI